MDDERNSKINEEFAKDFFIFIKSGNKTKLNELLEKSDIKFWEVTNSDQYNCITYKI